jgi:hypothetical protein
MYLAWGASGRRFKSGRPDHALAICHIAPFSQRGLATLTWSGSIKEAITEHVRVIEGGSGL